jgi:hypothetical protein
MNFGEKLEIDIATWQVIGCDTGRVVATFSHHERLMMKAMLTIYLPWLLSAITIYQIILTGNLHKKSWVIGLVNQALWLVWIVGTKTWGLLPMNLCLWAVYGRNHFKWNRQ